MLAVTIESSFTKAVAHPFDRLYVSFAKFFSDFSDMNIDGAVNNINIIAPHII